MRRTRGHKGQKIDADRDKWGEKEKVRGGNRRLFICFFFVVERGVSGLGLLRVVKSR